MFKKKPPEESKLDNVLDELLSNMKDTDSASEDYSKMADQVAKLYKLKEIDTPKRVSPDTVAAIAGNLLGILIIINHERANVITTKAIGFVSKLR